MIHFVKNENGEWVRQRNSPYEAVLQVNGRESIVVQLARLVDALPRDGEHALAMTFSDWRVLAICLKQLVNGHEAVGQIINQPDHEWIARQSAALSHWLGCVVDYLAVFSGRYESVLVEWADTDVDPDSHVASGGQPRIYHAVIKR